MIWENMTIALPSCHLYVHIFCAICIVKSACVYRQTDSLKWHKSFWIGLKQKNPQMIQFSWNKAPINRFDGSQLYRIESKLNEMEQKLRQLERSTQNKHTHTYTYTYTSVNSEIGIRSRWQSIHHFTERN